MLVELDIPFTQPTEINDPRVIALKNVHLSFDIDVPNLQTSTMLARANRRLSLYDGPISVTESGNELERQFDFVVATIRNVLNEAQTALAEEVIEVTTQLFE